MPSLYHYSRELIQFWPKAPSDYHISNDGTKPGGLWLSGSHRSNLDSWYKFVIRQADMDRSQWCHHDIRYETSFEVTYPIPEKIKVLSYEEEYREFISQFGLLNAQNQRCINWDEVRLADYKGIAILPFRRELSRRSNISEYFWNSFDTSSWCLWDTKYLFEEGHIKLIEENRLMQGLDLSFKCDDCNSYFQQNSI